MSTPRQYYDSIPPVAKTYATIGVLMATADALGLYEWQTIALYYEDVFKRFQIWKLITNFLFLGSFSLPFGFRLLMILRYGVSLERGPFDKRTADYVYMFFFGAFSLLILGVVPFLWSPFMSPSLVFMIVYVWSREFPNARVNIMGLVELKGFYLPWAMLALDLLFGSPLKPDILGMGVGHLYYFLTVLHPLAGGMNILRTPYWVLMLVAYWGKGYQMNSPVQRDQNRGVFQGTGRRVGGKQAPSGSTTENGRVRETNTSMPQNQGAFRGVGRRLN